MKRATSLFFALLLAASALAAKEPITHETLWMMKRVGAPNLSPDGKWVAYATVMKSRDLAERMGEQAYARGAQFTWPDTVKALLGLD